LPDRGIIDIVCNVHTPEAIAAGQFGVDEHFMDKVRMPEKMRRGTPIEEYVEMMDRAGVERRHKCLFGTDWPVIDPERAVREVDELGLRPESWQALMRDSAMRLFALPPSGVAAPALTAGEGA
jgi:hypothetical protein